MLAQPQGSGEQPVTTIKVGTNEFINMKNDRSCGNFDALQWLKLQFLSEESLFALDDKFEMIPDKDVPKLLAETKLDKVCPKPNVVMENPSSDEALTRQGFYGLASHLVKDCEPGEGVLADAVFSVDLTGMAKYEVRRGFANYGAGLYFNADREPIAIKTIEGKTVCPGDGVQWEVAKFAWRASLVAYVTAVDHLFNVHFFTAAQMLRAVEVAFEADHPIKRFLQPFLMRTALINNQAGPALLAPHSILHHISSLTLDGLTALVTDTYKKGPEWIPLEQQIENKGPNTAKLVEDGDLPFYTDGLEVYRAYQEMFGKVVSEKDCTVQNDPQIVKFKDLLNEYTEFECLPKDCTRDDLVNLLSTYAFTVTCQHEQVGSISDSIETPWHGGIRIVPDAVKADKQTFIGGAILLALTSVQTPPLQSGFADFWKDDEERAIWQGFQDSLSEIVNRVAERNAMRPFQYRNCDPTVLQCAVSV